MKAKAYEHRRNQYVFEAHDPNEVPFFLDDQVVGISVLRDDSGAGRLKCFLVTLRNNKDAIVKAKGYQQDNRQYVFEGDDPNEVQFFLADQVVGISVLRDDSCKTGSSIVSIPL